MSSDMQEQGALPLLEEPVCMVTISAALYSDSSFLILLASFDVVQSAEVYLTTFWR